MTFIPDSFSVPQIPNDYETRRCIDLLRDKIAIAVLQMTKKKRDQGVNGWRYATWKERASEAYLIADEMIAASKGGSK